MNRNTIVCALLSAAVVGLGGCSGVGLGLSTSLSSHGSSVSVSATGEKQWPEPGSASWKTGSTPSKDALAAVAVGQSKDQVRGLLGVPHFSEGLFSVKTWHYKFVSPDGKECLYRIDFKEQRVSNVEWQTPECKSAYAISNEKK